MQTICVLVSGGLDSALLVRRLMDREVRLVPVYVRCGLSWERVELYWLRRFLSAERSSRLLPLHVIDMPLRSLYGAHWSLSGRRVPGAQSADRAVYLPGRNLLLISHAAVFCARRRLNRIALGILRGNPFGDATPQFFTQLARCLTQALQQPIQILTPLSRMRKAQLIRSTSGAPWQLTCSCLKPQGLLHCGRCNKCAERRRAFHEAGVLDPTSYAS